MSIDQRTLLHELACPKEKVWVVIAGKTPSDERQTAETRSE